MKTGFPAEKFEEAIQAFSREKQQHLQRKEYDHNYNYKFVDVDSISAAIIFIIGAVVWIWSYNVNLENYKQQQFQAQQIVNQGYAAQLDFNALPALQLAVKESKLSQQNLYDAKNKNVELKRSFFSGKETNWMSVFEWQLILGHSKAVLYDSLRQVQYTLSYNDWHDQQISNMVITKVPKFENGNIVIHAEYDPHEFIDTAGPAFIVAALVVMGLIVFYYTIFRFVFYAKRIFNELSGKKEWCYPDDMKNSVQRVINMREVENYSHSVVVKFAGNYYVAHVYNK